LILGDLCDFWMGARNGQTEILQHDGIRALLEFRARGGSLSMMAGNHDLWLCPFYERELGATLVTEPFDTTVHGIRLHLVHGHLLGARRRWKSWMESREFFEAFGKLPSPLAVLLDQLLERKNASSLVEDEERHLAVFRQYARSRLGQTDLVVIGHVHRPVADRGTDPRMIVLGGWQHGSSYLRVDPSGASFHVLPGDDGEPFTASAAFDALPNPIPLSTGPK
jgi:UDP-2,3-diacylglucosamine hydrolase